MLIFQIQDYSMRHFSTFLLVFILSLITGCQSKKRINCSKINWRDEGQKAATLGKKGDESLQSYLKQCKKKSKMVDSKAFSEGFKDGLKIFCRAKVGLSMGTSGMVYESTCPQGSEKTFLKGYINGRIIFLKEEVGLKSSEFSNAKDRFWRKQQEYLLLKNEDPEEAKMQRDFLDAYQEESNVLEKKLKTLKKELSYLKRKKEELNFN